MGHATESIIKSEKQVLKMYVILNHSKWFLVHFCTELLLKLV